MVASQLTQGMLRAAFRHRLVAPDADTGLVLLMEAVRAHAANTEAKPQDWRETIADAVANGLVHDPVRLPEGALQCHWHLELTPKGVAAVRALEGR